MKPNDSSSVGNILKQRNYLKPRGSTTERFRLAIQKDIFFREKIFMILSKEFSIYKR